MAARISRLFLVLAITTLGLIVVGATSEPAGAGGPITLYPLASNATPLGISGTAAGDLWVAGYVIDSSGGHPHMWRITTGGVPDGDFAASGFPGDARQVAAAPAGGAYFTEDLTGPAQGQPGAYIDASGNIAGPGINAAFAVAYGKGQVWWGGASTGGGAAVWSGFTPFLGPQNQGPAVLGSPIHALVAGPNANDTEVISGLHAVGFTYLGVYTPCPAFSLPSNSQLEDVTYQPANTFWFADQARASIWSETGPCTFTEHPVPDGTSPRAVTAGVDNNLYFTTSSGIWRLDPPSGGFVHYTDPGLVDPHDITSGSDGNIWFTDHNGHQIGKLDISPNIGLKSSIKFHPIPIGGQDHGVVPFTVGPTVRIVSIDSTDPLFVPGTPDDPSVPDNLRSDCPPNCLVGVTFAPPVGTAYGAHRATIEVTLSNGQVLDIDAKAVVVPSTPGHP